ncbi:Mismatch repair endonuclease PMS2 [Madurella mycetomatis]|uniref:DNA mismatch repair protein PMS1 n=1 Tax=Madurella mycetomatis TaxID=100816 RepID=A0A150AST9_9PEZI|nr:Mismatch repair endonuclease PMS2 [Madurella mycetomatis]
MASNVTIKAIESSAIHQIQSGQVIVDLCSVAKELVENSVDAGATAIEVRFKNQGLDSIEVQDNGSGIASHNYESIALKHHTSKLSSYDDLSTLHTFGFRGEALSSLCALSRFSVVTCTQAEAPRATRIEFEASGKLKKTSVVSGQRGTTVAVEDLFHNLPVRRRELERNIKREWGKVIGLLNQYACVQTGVKFTVSQQPTKGKRMILFSTKGNPTTRENIVNVFGVKTMNALVTMDLRLELTPSTGPLNKGKARADGGTAEVRILGHVSRPIHGEGRQTPDRQMFYVNGRPCGLPQFAKVFNEVYKSYNSSQSPFIFADIQLDTHLYDVNVSPDKRTILLHDQGQMLDNLRESLIELFETQDVTIPVQAPSLKQTPLKTPTVTRSETPASVQGRRNKSATVELQQHHPLGDAEANDSEDGHDHEAEQEENDEPRTRSKTQLPHRPTSSTTAKAQGFTLLSHWLRSEPDTDGHSDVKNPSVRKHAKVIPDQTPASSSVLEWEDGSPRSGATEEQASPSEDSTGELDHRAARAKDFNARSAEQRNMLNLDPEQPGLPKTSGGMPAERDEPEQPIPALPPPSQPPAPRSTPPSTARPFKRSTQEVATITIGDHTVTSVIGNPSKKPRVEEIPKAATIGPGKRRQRNTPLPSFGGRLSQLFSASARPGDGEAQNIGVVAEDAETEGMDIIDEQDGVDEDSLFVSQADSERIHDGEDHGEDEDKASETQRLTSAQSEEPEAASDADNPLGSAKHSPSCHGDHTEDDDEYIDEDQKKAQEDQKVQGMIDVAAAAAIEPSEEGERRSELFLKGRSKRKERTLNLVQHVKVSEDEIQQRIAGLAAYLPQPRPRTAAAEDSNSLDADDAEEKLSLKISKSDFSRMRIIGQFNLGFILAVREAAASSPSASAPSPGSNDNEDDELFIIDQHASDEKYNFERLQQTTTVQSQRLVQPKTLELTALEEEIILEHLPALERNGFSVRVDTSGLQPVGSRCQLLSLPLSRETTFSLSDLEELIFLLAENPTSNATTIPRPSKVRKMFAMRACRSSIMIGKALSRRQMEKVVRHMGEMEKPWNCPHGRPTMRHLCGLGGAWGERLWEEGEDRGGRTDWAAWAQEKRGEE